MALIGSYKLLLFTNDIYIHIFIHTSVLVCYTVMPTMFANKR